MIFRKELLIELVVALLATIIPVSIQGQTTALGKLHPLPSISTPREALKRAIQVTGIEDLKTILASGDDSSNVALIKYEDSTFPCLAGQLNGRSCWHVKIDSFYTAKGKTDFKGSESEQTKHVDIYLDSASGQFIKMLITAYGPDSTGLPPELPWRISTRQLMQFEHYQGLVDYTVPTCVMGILQRPIRGAARAHETIIYLVMHSRLASPASQARWVIIFRGIEPLPVMGPYPAREKRIRMGRVRTIWDVVTGDPVSLLEEPYYPPDTWDKIP